MLGQRLHRTHWTELPIPAEVQDCINRLGRRAHAHHGLAFTDSDGNNLGTLYPSDDDGEDDSASYAISQDSDYDADAVSNSSLDDSNNGSDGPRVPDPAEPQPGQLAGVDNTNGPGDTTGVSGTPGVDNGNNIKAAGVYNEGGQKQHQNHRSGR
jgi:hypothetical protein